MKSTQFPLAKLGPLELDVNWFKYFKWMVSAGKLSKDINL